jgi:hypothetical protein
MELKRDPLPYLLAHGGPHHRLAWALAGGSVEETDLELIAVITGWQNGDGSFPPPGLSGKPGSVPATANLTELLMRAGAGDPADRAAVWLANQQRNDGGFAENPALADSLKPEWEWLSATRPVTWVTALAMQALNAAGGYHAPVNRARNFLLRARNRDGGWPGQVGEGYPDRTDLWTLGDVVKGLLAVGIAANHDVFRGLPAALERQKAGWRDPVANPLPTWLALGRRLSDANVQEGLKLLVATQNDDGGWPYLADRESHPDTTLAFMTLLVKYGLHAFK